MASTKDILLSILQFLDEEKFEKTLHTLEKESGIYFSMKHFEDTVTNGDFDEAERYLSGFATIDDGRHSRKLFFSLRKQKYLEALDRKDYAQAVHILKKDLKAFAEKDKALFEDIVMLLTLDNFREKRELSTIKDMKSQRPLLLRELIQIIKAHPFLKDKLQVPSSINVRLRTLLDQSLKEQYQINVPSAPFPFINMPNTGNARPIGAQMVNPFPFINMPNTGNARPIGAQRVNPFLFINVPNTGNARPIGAQRRAPADFTLKTRDLVSRLVGFDPACNSATVIRRDMLEGLNLDISLKPLVSCGISDKNGDNQSQPEWKLTEISRPSQLCSLCLPDLALAARIMKLMYTKFGNTLLALSSNGVHEIWVWPVDQFNAGGKASAKVKPRLYVPSSGLHKTNETVEANSEEAVACFILSPNNTFVISASGGKIFLYNMETFETKLTFKTPPPAATVFAFHPKNCNVTAIGMDDSTIQIYNYPNDKLIRKLEGHQKRVTGLAFSNVLDILVSAGSDSLLCVWGIYEWEMRTSKFLQMPAERDPNSYSRTQVQFHKDELSVLAVHETQLAVYKAPEMEVMKQWFPPPESPSPITYATYSSDSKSIFVSFKDGRIAVLVSKTLVLKCMINPAAYYPSDPRTVYPVALAAHPSEPNQLAVGLTDGAVYILEPLESDAEWGTLPPENDAVNATGLINS